MRFLARACRRALPAVALATAAALALTGCISSGEKPADSSGQPAASGAADLPGVPVQVSDTVPDLPTQPQLGIAVTPTPAGVPPWTSSPGLVQGETVVVTSDLLDAAQPDMWEQGAGIGAYNLSSGEALWTVDYADAAFGVPTDVQPDDFTSQVMAADGDTVAVLASWLVCPNDECDDETPEGFVLAAIATATGEVLSATSGEGLYPVLVAADSGVIVYSTSWDDLVAVKAGDVGGAPVWTSTAYDASSDAVIGTAVYAEDGWVEIATGEPAPYTVPIDWFDSYQVIDDASVIVSDSPEAVEEESDTEADDADAGAEEPDAEEEVAEDSDPASTPSEPVEHTVSLVNAESGDIVWEASVPMAVDESEMFYPAGEAIIVSYDSEFTSRTVALSRADGSILWQDDERSASQATDRWVLLDSSGLAETWGVAEVATGTQVAEVPAGEMGLASVVFASDYAYVVSDAPTSGDTAATEAATTAALIGLALTGEQAGSTAWSIDLGAAAVRVSSELGPLLLVYDDTGELRAVGTAK